MTVDAEYTTGEILEKAGLNTVLGMGTVFVVLISFR
ncbi:MAG: OadG family protein [[Clostridium] scindens]